MGSEVDLGWDPSWECGVGLWELLFDVVAGVCSLPSTIPHINKISPRLSGQVARH